MQGTRRAAWHHHPGYTSGTHCLGDNIVAGMRAIGTLRPKSEKEVQTRRGYNFDSRSTSIPRAAQVAIPSVLTTTSDCAARARKRSWSCRCSRSRMTLRLFTLAWTKGLVALAVVKTGTGDGPDPHRRLDFDHIGAEISQDTADKGPEWCGDIQDAGLPALPGLSWLAVVIGAPAARLFTRTPVDRHTQQLRACSSATTSRGRLVLERLLTMPATRLTWYDVGSVWIGFGCAGRQLGGPYLALRGFSQAHAGRRELRDRPPTSCQGKDARLLCLDFSKPLRNNVPGGFGKNRILQLAFPDLLANHTGYRRKA